MKNTNVKITSFSSCHQYQKGYGLIEILVSMLVLAIGLLGVAGLQTQSIRFNHEAYLRTQATVLAHDIIDRMRVNRTTAIDTDKYKFALNDSPLASVTSCEIAECIASDIAVYDFAQWRADIASSLPNGKGAVTPIDRVGAQTWREFTVQISYDSASTDSNASSPTTVTLDYRTRI